MSVVAVKKYDNKIVVAADSQITYGGTNRKFTDVKMRKINSDLELELREQQKLAGCYGFILKLILLNQLAVKKLL